MFNSKSVRNALLIALLVTTVLVGTPRPPGVRPALADAGGTPGWVDGVTLVKFVEGTDEQTKLAVLWGCHANFGAEIDQIGTWIVWVPKGLVEKAVACLQADPHVQYAEPDYLAQGDFTPNDEYYNSRQYGPQIIQADLAWDITTGDPNVVVAVVDSGADFSHPDLQGKLIAGWDYVNNDADPSDDHGHGTHVAGIVGAATNDTTGIAGIGFNTRLLVVKVLDQYNSGSYSNIALGITYAADQGAQVINLSLGGSSWSSTVLDAVEYAWGKGCLLVAAAGNSASNAPFYPAAYDHVMGVSATDASDGRWSGSNYGDYVSVSAPGASIYSTNWAGGSSGYRYRSGTSQAAPHVSGVAALLLAQDGSRSNSQVWSIIESTADDLGPGGWDPYFGYGRVNAYKALSNGQPTPTPTVVPLTPTPTPTPTPVPTATPGNSSTLNISSLETGYYTGKGKDKTWTPATVFEPGAKMYIRAHVVSAANGTDVDGAMVYLRVTAPNGGQTSLNASSDGSGIAEMRYNDTGIAGDYLYHVENVVASGWSYAAGSSVTEGSFVVASAEPTPTPTPTPGSSGPIISDVAAVNITSDSARIVWTTDIPATSQVEYGRTPTYGSLTPFDTTLVTSHSVTLTGLNSNKVYHYRVYSQYSEGNLSISEDYQFKTAR